MATANQEARNVWELIPSGQLVTFTLDNVEFGLDIERVQEITQKIEITPVPGAPSFVLGVINLRGMIIPVIDSRLRFHLQSQPATTRTRIIILNLGGLPTGLQVDSVSEVVKIERQDILKTPPLVAGVRSEYLAGMVAVGSRLITLIDLDQILNSAEFGHRSVLIERQNASGLGLVTENKPLVVEEENAFVTFSLGTESFGIDLLLVEEVIDLPLVTKVPDAPSYVMGVICLREQVLPLLDLNRLLSAEGNNSEIKPEMVILLSLGEIRLGVAVDAIQEIIRVRKQDILPTPHTLSDSEISRLQGVVIRSNRMISLIKIINVISGEDQEKIAAMGGSLTERKKEIVQENFDLPLVVFRLGEETFGLILHEVREIILVGLVTPVPRAPSFIEGVLNLRGEVMPVIDLRERFGLQRVERTNQSRIIITPIGGVYTGLVVDMVDEVRNVDKRQLEEPPRITAAKKNAYITKVARTNNTVIFLLDLQLLLTTTENNQLSAFQGNKKAES